MPRAAVDKAMIERFKRAVCACPYEPWVDLRANPGTASDFWRAAAIGRPGRSI